MTNEISGSSLLLILTDLPEDALVVIFGYCDFKTLLNIAQVCRVFYRVASQDCLWKPVLRKCVNANGPPSHKSSNNSTLKECCRISFNWVRGQYRETTMIKFCEKLLPWLQLDHNILFVSKENGIEVFNHHQAKKKASKPVSSIITNEIVRFVVKQGMLVSGCMGKTVTVWNTKDNKRYKKRVAFHGHTKPVYCVDVLDDIAISGSRDRSVKIWSLHLGKCVNTIQIGDPVRSVVVDSFNRTFVTGSAGYLARHSPLRLYDCEIGRSLCELICDSTQRYGAGVIDMKFESANVLISCGYDTAVRMWDMRANSRHCVRKWEDPHDSAVYCIDSDRKWLILSGTNRYGVVRMWDKRMDHSVKYYNVDRHSTSPVYSLRFNQTKLFVAMDKKVNVLNFEV